MPGSALTPQAAVERLDAMSGEVRAAVVLDHRGEVAARAGDAGAPEELGPMARDLFAAADVAGARAGVERVDRVEVSRPEGGVFGLRDRDRADGTLVLVATTAAGALSALVLYDLRMTLQAIGEAS